MNPTNTRAVRRAFTLTEILVAVGIIVILIGLLLPALSKVTQRAKVTETQALMQEFAKACDAFYLQFGYYPGIVSENSLVLADGTPPILSGMENALLHLMGGAVRNDDPDYASFGGTELTFGNGVKIKFDPSEIGKRTRINGEWFPPFFTPKGNQLGLALGQVNESVQIPELLDSWGQPVAFARSLRSSGPLTGPRSTNPQFLIEPLMSYTTSPALGELAQDQTTGNSGAYSLLNNTLSPYGMYGAILRHPGLGKFSTLGDAQYGTARGKYVLISAGADGIFYSVKDGIGSTAMTNADYAKPGLAERYNDIIVFGGG
ncbi:MAG: hypothetical protein O2819_02195 [Planctomycetota bacterium]|nr:hypothetical protein [Planctomycetota bacterium]MDA1106318.1 hypothetical protein [Planctomycetota bacterium]